MCGSLVWCLLRAVVFRFVFDHLRLSFCLEAHKHKHVRITVVLHPQFSFMMDSDNNANVGPNANHISDFHSCSLKLLTYNLFIRPPLIRNNNSDHKVW